VKHSLCWHSSKCTYSFVSTPFLPSNCSCPLHVVLEVAVCLLLRLR